MHLVQHCNYIHYVVFDMSHTFINLSQAISSKRAFNTFTCTEDCSNIQYIVVHLNSRQVQFIALN